MSSTAFYLRTTGDTVNNVFPENKTLDNHMVGVFSVHGSVKTQTPNAPIFLCCDLCETSVVGDYGSLPILRQLRLEDTPRKDGSHQVVNDFSRVLWINTVNTPFTSVRLYLTNGEGRLVNVDDCKLYCTLLVFDKS